MGESDDEYDGRRRDKFRGERFESYSRESSSSGGSRHGARRYRPTSSEPPVKIFRGEIFDNVRYTVDACSGRPHMIPSADKPPLRMLSFKMFMDRQDDHISHEEACEKYKEYKETFKIQLINEFFITHQGEEWLKIKYHPQDSAKRYEEKYGFINKRLEVFKEFLESGMIESVSLEAEKAKDLVKLMDKFVIRLEGGSFDDFNILEVENKPQIIELGCKMDEETAEKNKMEQPLECSELKSDENQIVDLENPKIEKRKNFHKNSSILLKNLNLNVTKAELKAKFQKYPGFLRIALSEPHRLPNNTWQRCGWVTFEKHINVKEISWQVNPTMEASINKDLIYRVRFVDGMTAYKHVAKKDVKHATNMILNLDAKYKLWSSERDDPFGNFKNPVLKNVSNFIIEEVSAEEEQLLGALQLEDVLERDEDLLHALDKLILYLRFVYSVDYYKHCEYQQEDEMPSRCGLIHVRGKREPDGITHQKLDDYCRNFDIKISNLFAEQELTKEQLIKLGIKNEETEIEKFLSVNMKEIVTDKWMCMICNKRFQNTLFVKKHIFNKHQKSIDDVKTNVQYLNNYLKDPKRPSDVPVEKAQSAPVMPQPPIYGPPCPYGPYYGNPFRWNRGGLRVHNRGPPIPLHPRSLIGYRDLDAPQPIEEFF